MVSPVSRPPLQWTQSDIHSHVPSNRPCKAETKIYIHYVLFISHTFLFFFSIFFISCLRFFFHSTFFLFYLLFLSAGISLFCISFFEKLIWAIIAIIAECTQHYTFFVIVNTCHKKTKNNNELILLKHILLYFMSLLLCAIDNQKALKTHQWAPLLHWQRCSTISVRVGTVIYFEINPTYTVVLS